MTVVALLLVTLFLAYANGANDNFKGVATLYGSGRFSYRKALSFATLAQIAGSMVSVLLAAALVKAFSGKGLVANEVVASSEFLISIALGTAITVMLATRLGFPISTTHALTGALAGCAFFANSGALDTGTLAQGYFLPLLASPVLAVATTAPVYFLGQKIASHAGLTETSCVCVSPAENATALQPAASTGALTTNNSSPITVHVDDIENCQRQAAQERVFGVSIDALMTSAHMASAFALCFARGLNDTPKIVGIILAAKAFDANLSLTAVAIAMAIGGWLHSRKVADRMSLDITTMRDGDALTANSVAAFYVIGASHLGLPVSTTHVTVGAISGVGLMTKRANLAVIRDILLAWVITLPVAAVLGMAAFAIFRL